MLSTLLAAGLIVPAQTPELPFPLDRLPDPADGRIVEYRPDLTAVAGLTKTDRVRLLGVPVAHGELADVTLRRVQLDRLEVGLQVDGQPAPQVIDGLDLSLWRGHIDGAERSDVTLAFSNHGVRGWVRDGATLTHLMPVPGPAGDWSQSTTWIVDDERLAEFGFDASFTCAADEAVIASERTPRRPDAAHASRDAGGALVPFDTAVHEDSPCLLRSCSIALETDYQHNQIFGGSVPAQTAYTMSLVGAIADTYEDELGVLLTFPYMQLYTTPADPWTTPETTFAVLDYLFELKAAWTGNIPGGARIGHILSGAFLDGGIAYIDILCEETANYAFGVTANQDGGVSFPVTTQPFNWDFTATSHELGHNFGAVHTFDWTPLLDDCPSVCEVGTIMSYCHLCPGGTANIQPVFHPAVRDWLLDEVVHCLPVESGVIVDPPLAWDPAGTTAVVAEVAGTPAGPVELNWRTDAGQAFQQVPMIDAGAGLWTAALPAVPCGTSPEFFVSTVDAACGSASTPTYAPPVAGLQVVFADDFETDKGWSPSAPGDTAFAGLWERADPVGSYAEAYDDHTPGGTLAWITEAHSGGEAFASDVDGGVTTLVSPIIDLSGGDATVRYERWYHNIAAIAPGLDFLQVDVSDDGGGSWTPVEIVGPFDEQATGGWHPFEFVVSDYVTPTSQVQVRFVAKDSFDTTVEAGLDDFLVYRLDCTVCQPDLGFGGPGDLTLSFCGDPLTSSGSADLVLANATPGTTAWIAASASLTPVPLFGGTIVTVPLDVLLVGTADGSGQWALTGLTSSVAAPVTLYLQGLAVDLSLPQLIEISNALGAEYLP